MRFVYNQLTNTIHHHPIWPDQTETWRSLDITRGVEEFRQKDGNLALVCDATSVEKAREKFEKWAAAAENGGDLYQTRFFDNPEKAGEY